MRDEEEDGIVREETSILKEGTKGGESLRGKRNRLKSERRRKKGKENRQKVGPLDDE